MSKKSFANTITAWDLGETASSVMTDCEKFGMTYGCKEDCPQLERGECEIYENVEQYLKEQT